MDESRLNTPAVLTDLVSYQAGSVVSQTLAKSKAGTVTLFAFDKGEGLSEHTAPFDAFAVLLDGRATVSVGGTSHAMTSGQLLRLPANVPHALKADEPFKMLLIMIREQDA